MDDPALDPVTHERALCGLRRINWWSRTDRVLWKAIVQGIQDINSDAPLTVLDIACGGGDLAIRLARRAAARGIRIVVEGCDMSPVAIRSATSHAQAARLANVRFTRCNVLQEPLPQPCYDVVMCSLFLHHLDEGNAVKLLENMQSAARQLVLVDDLRRSRIGYWLARVGSRVLSGSTIVHVDGPMSVEAAFTLDEARSLALKAGIRNVKIQPHWPQRYLLTSVQNRDGASGPSSGTSR